MKLQNYFFLLTLLGIIGCSKSNTDKMSAPEMNNNQNLFYQIKTYTFDNEAQATLTESFVKNAYIPALKRQNITNIGVFKTRLTDKDTVNKLYILLPLKSITQVLSIEESLKTDMAYKNAGKEFLQAPYNKSPYRRIESTILKPFERMPFLKPSPLTGPRANRIYELRSYESASEEIHENKVDMFNAGGEVALFEKLGFNAVFYGQIVSGSKMPNLMYMTTFENQTSRDAHWKAFGEAPEWNVMKSLPKYQNNVSHIDIMYLYPTEYSDY